MYLSVFNLYRKRHLGVIITVFGALQVSQLGDGETSVHRLAESKYINKGAPT